MKLLLNKEPVYLTETVYDGQAEQGVEFDYVLPDYYPDIFKILKCTLTPGIVSYNVSGTQLFIDGVVYIKVLYLSENSSDINCIEQRFTYSKTIELVRSAEKPVVTFSQKADYCNCRAVSGRRIDVRGAVSTKIKVTGCSESEILSGAEGHGIQVKRDSISYCGSRLYASRQYVAREDIETGTGSGISSILTTSCCASVTDTKIIADKVVIKGEAKIKALYLTRSGECMETEVMEAVIPLSQIVDVEGITETHNCYARFDVMDCDLEVKQGDDGENRLLGCEITVDCKVNAYKENIISPVCDIYSTDYECNFSTTPVKLEHTPNYLLTQYGMKSSVEYNDDTISEVFDCKCELSGYTVRSAEESGKMTVSGQVNIWLIGKNGSGNPIFIEKTEPFEFPTDMESENGAYSADIAVTVTNVSYSISGDNTADIQIQLSAQGLIYKIKTVNIVNEINVVEELPKNKSSDYALKLYYADKGEKVWDIAKKYNTSVSAVLTENELEDEQLTGSCMLLIPIV